VDCGFCEETLIESLDVSIIIMLHADLDVFVLDLEGESHNGTPGSTDPTLIQPWNIQNVNVI
jgi:hypothetical protein